MDWRTPKSWITTGTLLLLPSIVFIVLLIFNNAFIDALIQLNSYSTGTILQSGFINNINILFIIGLCLGFLVAHFYISYFKFYEKLNIGNLLLTLIFAILTISALTIAFPGNTYIFSTTNTILDLL